MPPLTTAAVANHDALSNHTPRSPHLAGSFARPYRRTASSSKLSTSSPVPTSPGAGSSPQISKKLPGFFPRLLLNQSSLKRLGSNQRKSGVSDSTESSYLRSPVSSSFSPASQTTDDAKSPKTSLNIFRSWSSAANPTPPCGPSDIGLPSITRVELAQIWTHAIYLANMNRHQNARLLFKHLISRRGVPAHLLPLLAINSGMLMLREHAIFPALHMFHIISQQMCHAGPLKTLALFAMGIAAWYLASANYETQTAIASTNSSKDNVKTVNEQTLDRAKLFFTLSLDGMGELDAINYDYIGLDFKLKRVMILQNVFSCGKAVLLIHEPGSSFSLSSISIHGLPSHSLFMPLELRSSSESFNTEIDFSLLPDLGTLKRHTSVEDEALWSRLNECILDEEYNRGEVSPSSVHTTNMVDRGDAIAKPLPPLPMRMPPRSRRR